MKQSDAFVAFASWEDRFRLGFDQTIEAADPARVVLYCFDEYAEWTADNRGYIRGLCERRGIECVEERLSVDTAAENWRMVKDGLVARIAAGSRVIVDITTMPREIIWFVFWTLELLGCKIDYHYFRPAPGGYGNWLSREPQRPRLVYKLSGITRLKARTALVVLAGYDVDRTKQLVNFFEPQITLLGLQTQDKDPANAEWMRRQREQAAKFAQDGPVECFFVDAYAPDRGETIVEAQIRPYLGTHNLIMSSLGPKLSAVALYRLHRTNRVTALAYAPSKEFNREYSKGIGEGVYGTL